MTVSISIESNNLQLISSGFLFAKLNKPVKMSIFIDDEKTLSVSLYIHSELHSEGENMVRHISEDGTTDEWHIYESEDGESKFTPEPVSVVCYEFDGIIKTIYLQVQTTKLRDGLYEVKYVWWEGNADGAQVGMS